MLKKLLSKIPGLNEGWFDLTGLTCLVGAAYLAFGDAAALAAAGVSLIIIRLLMAE